MSTIKHKRRGILVSVCLALLAGSLWLFCGCLPDCLHINIEEQTFTADCDSAGYTLHRCADCGLEYRTDVVSPAEHDLAATVTLPTCTAEGYTTYACNNCDYTYRGDAVAPLPHALKETATAATCTLEGYTTYACKHCDYTYRGNAVPPLAHDLTATVTAATCTEAGQILYDCEHCDYARTQPLAILPHSYEAQILEPTCDVGGHTAYTCTACGQSYVGEHTDPTGHSFDAETVGPTTCLATGYTRYTCEVCDRSYIGDLVFYSDVFPGAYGVSETPLCQGVDISKYNHLTDGAGNYLPLDFEAIAAAGYEFVILKIGSTPRIGSDGVFRGGMEPTFEADYAAARAAGLHVGVYFYTYARTPEAAAYDAALVMKWLGDRTLDYPVYFDLEDRSVEALGRRAATELCLSFISTLQADRYYGALYTNNNWLTNLLQTDKVTFLFDIWYARYPSGEGPFVWNTEKYGPGVGMWQYSQSGKIEGLPASLSFDLNYAYRDYPSLIRGLGYNGHAKPAPEEDLPPEA